VQKFTTVLTRFMRKLMKRWGSPRVLITDKLLSYGVAVRNLCPASIIVGIKASTIDVKRHIAIPDDKRRSWGALNPLVRRRCFVRP